MGDIDNDKHEEVAIGAPYYGDNGAVFIFYGSQTGISNRNPQIILGKEISQKPKGFGIAVAKISPNTLAIGAHSSNQVILIKSRPVIRFLPTSNAQSLTSMIELDSEQNSIELQVELNLDEATLQFKNILGLSASINFILLPLLYP